MSLRSSQGVVAWINFISVTPWLDHGIQLKILKLLVFFIVFIDPVVKPRGDSEKPVNAHVKEANLPLQN
ncbi:MAG: hypothetical protein ACEY3D_03445 [Rickettsia sp.]|uniref:hypothetical protein n=1 Tax=Rickettsia sp. TaxID=789 RepID=UPI00397E6ADB